MASRLVYIGDEDASLGKEDYGIHAFGPGDTSDCGSDWQGGFGDEEEAIFGAGDAIDDDFEIEPDDEIDAFGGEFGAETRGESADEFAARIDGA